MFQVATKTKGRHGGGLFNNQIFLAVGRSNSGVFYQLSQHVMVKMEKLWNGIRFRLKGLRKMLGPTVKRACIGIIGAYVLGAVPPYNLLLGGKCVACLIRSREIFDDFAKKYGGSCGVISGLSWCRVSARLQTTARPDLTFWMPNVKHSRAAIATISP